MKKILFLNSHPYSGSMELYDTLSKNSYIQGYRNYRQKIYSNHYDFFQILTQKHKRDDKHAIYLDEIYFNYALSTRMDLSSCYFIHIIRSPDYLNFITEKINFEFFIKRYLYRLRRICEIAKRTPKSIFFTFEDLKKEESMDMIKDFLSLKDKPDLPNLDNVTPGITKDCIPYGVMKKTEASYEKYLAYLKQQNLLKLI